MAPSDIPLKEQSNEIFDIRSFSPKNWLSGVSDSREIDSSWYQNQWDWLARVYNVRKAIQILHEIFLVVMFSPLHFMLYRGKSKPLGQCKTPESEIRVAAKKFCFANFTKFSLNFLISWFAKFPSNFAKFRKTRNRNLGNFLLFCQNEMIF